jgi:hypothetical protein
MNYYRGGKNIIRTGSVQGNEMKAGPIPATRQLSRQEEKLKLPLLLLSPAEAAERELRRNLLPGPEK